MRVTVLALATMFLVTGCSKEILDWRNAQINNGQVFKGDENTPFSGQVTSLPYAQIKALAPIIRDTVVFGESLGAPINDGQADSSACTAPVAKGYISGEVTCTIQGRTYLTAEFDNGKPTGEFKWGATNSGDPIVEAAIDENGKLDGKVTFHQPKDDGLYAVLNYSHGVWEGEQTGYLKDGKTVGIKISFKGGNPGGSQHVVALQTTHADPLPALDVTMDDNGKLDGTLTTWETGFNGGIDDHPEHKTMESHWSHGDPVDCTTYGATFKNSQSGWEALWSGKWDPSQNKYVSTAPPAPGVYEPSVGQCEVFPAKFVRANM